MSASERDRAVQGSGNAAPANAPDTEPREVAGMCRDGCHDQVQNLIAQCAELVACGAQRFFADDPGLRLAARGLLFSLADACVHDSQFVHGNLDSEDEVRVIGVLRTLEPATDTEVWALLSAHVPKLRDLA